MADPVVYPGLASNLTLFVLSNPMARCIIWSSNFWPKTFLMKPTTKTLFNIHVFISILRSWPWSINVFTRSARAWKSSDIKTNQVKWNYGKLFWLLFILKTYWQLPKTVAHKISVKNAFDADFESCRIFFLNHGVSILHLASLRKVSFYNIALNFNAKKKNEKKNVISKHSFF